MTFKIDSVLSCSSFSKPTQMMPMSMTLEWRKGKFSSFILSSMEFNWKTIRIASNFFISRRTMNQRINSNACSGTLTDDLDCGLASKKSKTKASQCKINNTRKDIFHDAAHVLGPWIDFFFSRFSITVRLTGEWRWKWEKCSVTTSFPDSQLAIAIVMWTRLRNWGWAHCNPPDVSHLHP